MRINALRLIKQGDIRIFVADNQQNSKHPPLPNANIVEIYYMLNEFSNLFDMANLCRGLIAYSFLSNKPKIHLANGSAAIHQTML